jgi:hypothetical protein
MRAVFGGTSVRPLICRQNGIHWVPCQTSGHCLSKRRLSSRRWIAFLSPNCRMDRSGPTKSYVARHIRFLLWRSALCGAGDAHQPAIRPEPSLVPHNSHDSASQTDASTRLPPGRHGANTRQTDESARSTARNGELVQIVTARHLAYSAWIGLDTMSFLSSISRASS